MQRTQGYATRKIEGTTGSPYASNSDFARAMREFREICYTNCANARDHEWDDIDVLDWCDENMDEEGCLC